VVAKVEDQHIGSILVADCGTQMTKVALLDRVDGHYRFIAHGESPTTVGKPWNDLSAGIRYATDQISDVTGRRFWDDNGDLIAPEGPEYDGIDAFAATVSAGPPLEIVLAGLAHDLSVMSGLRATSGTYSQAKDVVAADDKGGLSDRERITRIRNADPEVICVVGGTDGGAEGPVLELVRIATWAAKLQRSGQYPRLLYMGNSRLRKQVADIVGGDIKLYVADNVRPSIEVENLSSAQAELDKIYVRDNLGSVPGIDTVADWSAVPLVPTARAFGRIMEYLWHLGDPRHGVIGVDLGSANLTLAAVFDGQLSLSIRSDLGMAYCGEYVTKKRGVEAITRWLPENVSEYDILGYFLNKQAHPLTVPEEIREQHIDYAVAREAIGIALEAARPGWHPATVIDSGEQLLPSCDTIVVGGSLLAHAPRPGQAALAVLDALQPVGVCTLVLDAHFLAPALGCTALIKSLASVEVLDSGGFVNLATVVTLVGRARAGDTVLRIGVTYDKGSSFDIEVHYGDLEILPLLPGRQADLELKPLHRFDVGFGPGRSGKRRVNGGLVGLIIDARGRPLQLPLDSRKCRMQMKRWLWDVGG